jgi:hypothetical protein
MYQRWDQVSSQTRTSGHTRGGIWWPDKQTPRYMYTRGGIWWPDKYRPLDIPEVGSGDQTNTDLWIYQRWDQLTGQIRISRYTRDGIRWPDKQKPLDILKVRSGADKGCTSPVAGHLHHESTEKFAVKMSKPRTASLVTLRLRESHQTGYDVIEGCIG